MGSFATLALNKYPVAESKNEFQLDHSSLFYAECLKSEKINEDGYTHDKEWYELKLHHVKDRLDLLGYSLAFVREVYENPSPDLEDDPLPICFDDALSVINNVDISKAENKFVEFPKVGKFTPIHIQNLVSSNRDLRFTIDTWDLDALLEPLCHNSCLRVLAESHHNLNLPVIWDFDEVVKNGWIKRNRVFHGAQNKFLIVTEGTSDAKIIKKAIDILRPHIKDFFYFVDMEDGYPFSGTGNLYNFVKGLSSINIKNDVVVIFDNDIEGIQAMNRCNSHNLPDNLKIMKLPDLEQFTSFPTVGPNSEENADINGKAASIECYLDLDYSAKVRWTNFREDTKCYHGSLIAKDQYKKVFLRQTEKCSNYDYRKLEQIIDNIVSNCINIATNARLKRLKGNLNTTNDIAQFNQK
jgi:mRNA-degrading endonuclease YafQ of YafQ-DinJ toxin-antitoxin module